LADARRALIVGAGIGGLTAALALSRRGVRVDIAERAAELSEIGAGIQLSPNAIRVLAELGLEPALSAVATEPSALEIRSGVTGALLTAISAATFRARYSYPYCVIHRADLQALLVEAVRKNDTIHLHLATEVTGLIEDAGKIRARAANPAFPDERFTVAIGADGVRSALRACVPGAGALRPAHRTAWRAMIAADAARDLLRADAVSAWLGPRAHLVCYPVSRGAMVNVVAIVEERSDEPGWGIAGDPAELLAHYASWSQPVRRLLAMPANWQKYALMRLDAAGAWSAGSLALLGDAAHAMLPFLAQGAVMAIEDAAVLARTLAGTADMPAALKSYEAQRKGRVGKVAAAAARTGDRYHLAGAMATARDLALRVAGERLILNELDWIYRWRPSGE
jgi:salicylate hydroxylase